MAAEELRCVDCGWVLTTADALCGEVVEDDDGLHHRECAESGAIVGNVNSLENGHLRRLLIEPKDGSHVPPEVAGRQFTYYEQLLAGGFADGRTARRYEQMERDDG